jgi:hypothetical protein
MASRELDYALDAFFTCNSGLGARNGFAEPRDREAKSTLPRPPPAAETARPAFEPAKMPAKCALFVRDRKTSVLIGLRGGGCSLDRTDLCPQIPAVREFYREFCGFGVNSANLRHN